MDISLGQPEKNFAKARHFVEVAHSQGNSLMLLPELWTTGYDLENAQILASQMDQGMFAQISALAREYHISLGGSILEIENGRIFNTFVLYDAEGHRSGLYRKTHLFRLMDEDRWLHPGDHPGLANTEAGKTGMAICYDLRFPELFRLYALNSATVVLIPAEWPNSRIDHWRTLLRARAIENQMYVVAANRVGESRGEVFGGHSMVIGPWGDLLVEGGLEECLLTTEIDPEETNRVRQKITVFQDRRPDIYG